VYIIFYKKIDLIDIIKNQTCLVDQSFEAWDVRESTTIITCMVSAKGIGNWSLENS